MRVDFVPNLSSDSHIRIIVETNSLLADIKMAFKYMDKENILQAIHIIHKAKTIVSS